MEAAKHEPDSVGEPEKAAHTEEHPTGSMALRCPVIPNSSIVTLRLREIKDGRIAGTKALLTDLLAVEVKSGPNLLQQRVGSALTVIAPLNLVEPFSPGDCIQTLARVIGDENGQGVVCMTPFQLTTPPAQ